MATRGRPKLDPAARAHSPRLAVRLPDRVRSLLARRAAEEERTVSDAVRGVVEAWASEPRASERAEIRRIVRLTDRQREALFFASNANVQQLFRRAR